MARVQLDRIEGDLAVLVYQGESFELPAALLPESAREGDTLELTLTADEDATRAAREAMARRRARLSRNDDGGDFSL